MIIKYRHCTPVFRCLLTTLAVGSALLPYSLAAADSAPTPPTDIAEAAASLGRLRGTGGLGGVERIVSDVAKLYVNRLADAAYYGFMEQACDVTMSIQTDYLSKEADVESIAETALLKNGPLNPAIHANLVIRLAASVVGRGYAHGLTTADIKAKRYIVAAEYLKLWAQIENATDPTFSLSNRQAELNVAPPVASGLPAGVDPAVITDPKLRSQYEQAIAANDALIDRSRNQKQLRDLASQLRPAMERHLAELYGASASDTAEMHELFAKYPISASEQSNILQRIASGSEEGVAGAARK